MENEWQELIAEFLEESKGIYSSSSKVKISDLGIKTIHKKFFCDISIVTWVEDSKKEILSVEKLYR